MALVLIVNGAIYNTPPRRASIGMGNRVLIVLSSRTLQSMHAISEACILLCIFGFRHEGELLIPRFRHRFKGRRSLRLFARVL